MSICVGPAPYRIVCDYSGCDEEGPAAYDEDEATEEAERYGWACSHGDDDCDDLCPKHYAMSPKCHGCPACRKARTAARLERIVNDDGN